MSTEIKPGDTIVTVQDTPSLFGHVVPKGTRGFVERSGPPIIGAFNVYARFQGDPIGRQVRPGDVAVIPATPAPLDPSKVKAGDTVTLTKGETSVRGPVTGISYAGGGEWDFRVGEESYRRTGRIGLWAVTAHQPAPEPEPEWKLGTVGTAGTVRGLGYTGPVVRADNPVMPWWTPAYIGGAHWHREADVTDFVPDEPRPLPTRDELAKAITRGTRRSVDDHAIIHKVNGHAAADRVLDLLGGAS